jgi:hypothetical protein
MNIFTIEKNNFRFWFVCVPTSSPQSLMLFLFCFL